MASYNHIRVGARALKPMLLPLGDRALLVRFGTHLDEDVNLRAITTTQCLIGADLVGVEEVSPTLVSVLIRYDPLKVGFFALSNAIRLALCEPDMTALASNNTLDIEVSYGGDEGPDLDFVAAQCGLSITAFIKAHNQAQLRVLATGFAPGFVYCGLHVPELHIARRTSLHGRVPPGSIIFAAGQTAITATHVPTGWHVIGRTKFRNFTASDNPPTKLQPGDIVSFCGGQDQ